MKTGRRDAMLLRAFGDRTEITITELRAAIYLAYTEAELLRRGCIFGNMTRAKTAYTEGTYITDKERNSIMRQGVGRVLRDISGKNWLEFDRQKGVVRRVRTELG